MPNQNYVLLNDMLLNHTLLNHNPLAKNSNPSPIVWQTTNGGQSDNPSLYGDFNLGLHVQDDPQAVHYNRIQLLQDIQQRYPHITSIHWLAQVHDDTIILVDDKLPKNVVSADAQITTKKHTALAIMTADCVPIMLATTDGSIIGAVHAGWKGLAKGIIGKTIKKIQNLAKEQGQTQDNQAPNIQAQSIQAWVGACISVQAYEVDERVRQQVLCQMQLEDTKIPRQFFIPVADKAGHYLANLPAITEYQLRQAGVSQIRQSGLDSHSDPRFYSYRQQTQQQQPFTGRMATVIFVG